MKNKLFPLVVALLAGWLGAPSLTLAQVPTIITAPAGQVSAVGGALTLGVVAGGGAPLAYQWFKDGRRLLCATNSTLTVTNVGLLNTGAYYVVVTNASGMVISGPALVAVGGPTLLAWGYDSYGQLGTGIATGSINPTPMLVATNVVTGAAGGYHSLFVRADGTLWVMGWNYDGQLGDGSTSQFNPLPARLATNVVATAAGWLYSLFVKADGTLWAMGENSSGELGNGTTTNISLPVCVASNVVAVAAGSEHSVFLKADGTLWTMGENDYGQLGDGLTGGANSSSTPVNVASNVVAVAAGEYTSLFVKADATLWAMGETSEQFGTPGNASLPVSVASNVVMVAAGDMHSLFVTADGTLWGAGSDYFGQLGNGLSGGQGSLPIPVATNVLAVAGGTEESMFVRPDGTLWATGQNAYGELGDGNNTNTDVPVKVPYVSVAGLFPADQAFHVLAIGAIPNRVQSTNGLPTVTFFGTPGATFKVGRSTDLKTWQNLWTTNAPDNGLFQYTDLGAPRTAAFYRLLPAP